MLRSILIVLFVVVINSDFVRAQHLLGGQIRTRFIYIDSPPRVSMALELYRDAESSAKEEILFDWGDGTTESLELLTTGVVNENLAVDFYGGIHHYDTTGYIVYEYRDSFLVSDVENIPNSGEQYLVLTDTVLVCDSINTPLLHPAINSYEGLIPISSVEGFLRRDDGSITKIFALVSLSGDESAPSTSTLSPYPIEGAFLPAATDSLSYLYEYLFIWDRPIASGKYGFQFRNRQFSNTNNPIYDDLQNENGHVLTNTLTRLIILEITEDMIVNNRKRVYQEELKLYPNPASTTATLEYANPNEDLVLNVRDARGRVVMRKTLSATERLQRETLDVSAWPPGVYWVELRNALGKITKKLIVE